MAEITDPGGGSTTIICTPSPNDEVAILHNLISRVSDIERFLNQMVGADVHANNLSELATDIGNILSGTLILPSTGSPLGPGGSIPVPPGFTGTVVSGNVITTWNNGVVSYEVIPGTGVTVGGDSPKRLMRTSMDYRSLVNSAGSVDLYLSNPAQFNDNIGASFASTYFTLPRTGYYFFAIHLEFQDMSYIRNGQITANITSNSDPTFLSWNHAWTSSAGNGESWIEGVNFSGIMHIIAGDSIFIDANQTSGANCDTRIMNLSVIEL